MSTITDRVACGAALLDTVRPDWRKEVSASDIDVSSMYLCPLAQLWGTFSDGVERLGWVGRPYENMISARDHGFDVGDDLDFEDDDDEYAALSAAWKVEAAK